MSKYNFTKYTTPKGLFVYPHLTKPDTKFNPLGEYSVKLSLPREDAKELVALMKAELKTYKENNSIKGTDKFNIAKDEEAGTLTFKTKLPAIIPLKDGTQWEQKLAIYDAKGNLMPKDISIWSGTQGKLQVELRPYSMAGNTGVSLRLKAVQVIELVEGESKSENESPFEEEEGYTTDNEPSPFSEENETKAEDTSDEEDF